MSWSGAKENSSSDSMLLRMEEKMRTVGAHLSLLCKFNLHYSCTSWVTLTQQLASVANLGARGRSEGWELYHTRPSRNSETAQGKVMDIPLPRHPAHSTLWED